MAFPDTIISYTEVVENSLSKKYHQALNSVSQVSHKLEVPYAVLGSIGVAATSNLSLNVMDYSGSWTTGMPDIDIFIIGTDHQREIFFKSVQSQLDDGSPLVDFSPGHHQNVRFDNDGNPTLRYKKISIPLSRLLFEPIFVNRFNTEIPVLHPQTYIAMVELCNNKIFPVRILERIRQLESVINSYTELGGELFDPFANFKAEILNRYPLHFPLIDLRRKIATTQSLQKDLHQLRTLAPGIFSLLRRLY